MAAKSKPAAESAGPVEQVSLYELFIGVITIISLAAMAVQFLFRENEVLYSILWIIDNLFCIIFLIDFGSRLYRAPSKMGYLKWQGIFDLLGSIPAMPALRLFRLFRLTRVARILRIGGPRRIVHEFVTRRSESALYLTIIMAILVIMFGSVFVYYAESFNPDANIQSGQDAVWWSVVTITTVGYGDRFPTTWPGRIVGMLTMIVGIGIFGVFTSFLANAFMSGPKPKEENTPAPSAPLPEDVGQQMAMYIGSLKLEIDQLKQIVDQERVLRATPAAPQPPNPGAD